MTKFVEGNSQFREKLHRFTKESLKVGDISTWVRRKRKPVLQTEGMEFGRHGDIPALRI